MIINTRVADRAAVEPDRGVKSKSEVRSLSGKLEVGSRKLEIGSRKSEVGRPSSAFVVQTSQFFIFLVCNFLRTTVYNKIALENLDRRQSNS